MDETVTEPATVSVTEAEPEAVTEAATVSVNEAEAVTVVGDRERVRDRAGGRGRVGDDGRCTGGDVPPLRPEA